MIIAFYFFIGFVILINQLTQLIKNNYPLKPITKFQEQEEDAIFLYPHINSENNKVVFFYEINDEANLQIIILKKDTIVIQEIIYGSKYDLIQEVENVFPDEEINIFVFNMN
jgi:hypothetical protein